ncbi:MAG: ATP-binding protein [Polyangiaceae bacterium]
MVSSYDDVSIGLIEQLGLLVDGAVTRIGCDNVCVHLLSLDRTRLICQAVSRGYRATALAFGLDLSACLAVSECLQTQRPIVVNDAMGDVRVARVARERYGLRACVYVPIVREGQSVGVLVASFQARTTWEQRHIDAATHEANEASSRLWALRSRVFGKAPSVTGPSEVSENAHAISRWRAMLDAVPGVCAIVNEDLLALEAHAGFSEGNAEVAPSSSVTVRDLFFHSERAVELRDAIRSMLAGELLWKGLITTVEGRFWRVDMRPVPMSEPPLASVFATPSSREVALCMTDVSDVFFAHEKLQASQHMQALGQLTSSIGHEFNNVLAILSTSCDALDATVGENEEAKKQVALIAATIQRGAKLTRQLLTFARVDHRNPRNFELITQLSTWWPFLENALGKGRKLSLTTSGPAWIVADPDQLELVIVNLLVNARDATREGAVITIQIESGTRHEQAFVTLAVQDHGIGMSSDVLARASEPFFTTKPRGRGTGLGLAIARDVVEASNGDFEIRSAIGDGTTVSMHFPAAEPGAVPSARRELPVTLTKHQKLIRVLVVDDEPLYGQGIKRGLENSGMSVRIVGSGAEALRFLEAEPDWPDVVLLDFMLTDTTGSALLPKIHGIRESLPVLICTGYGDTEDLRRALSTAHGILTKPMTLSAVRAAIDAAVVSS